MKPMDVIIYGKSQWTRETQFVVNVFRALNILEQNRDSYERPIFNAPNCHAPSYITYAAIA
jgi:hypothetical protein